MCISVGSIVGGGGARAPHVTENMGVSPKCGYNIWLIQAMIQGANGDGFIGAKASISPCF